MNKINLGCGNVPLVGYTNIDKYYYPGSTVEFNDNNLALNWNEEHPDSLWIYGDIADPVGLKDNYYDEILMVHIIEHLSMNDGKKAIQQAFRICKPGGFIEIETPDLLVACQLLLQLEENTPLWYRAMGLVYGTKGEDGQGQFHLCGYTEKYLTRIMKENGFINIENILVGFGHGNNEEGHPEPQYDFRLKGQKPL